MRRVVFSSIIFVTMLIFGFITLYKVEHVCIQMTDLAEEIEYYVENEDFQNAKKSSEEFSKLWHHYESRLILILRHSPLDSITSSTSKMVSLVESEDSSDALAELRHIKTILHNIYTGEIPYLNNIF